MDFSKHPLNNNSTIVLKLKNPIVTIVNSNEPDVVDVLLKDCSDLIDSRFVPWFAKRFYKLNKEGVLTGASLARNDSKKDPRKFFAHLVKEAYNEKN